MKVPINSDKIITTSYYGKRRYKYQGKIVEDFHHGVDIVPSPCNNNEILAFEDGVVTGVQKIGEQYKTGCYVRIKHSNGLYTLYYHLKSNTIVVNKGDSVKKGQKLGIIGTTGQSTGIHLHFQIDKGSSSSSINPYDYLFNGKELIEKPDVPPTPTPTPQPESEYYVVQKGDNLTKIARKYGTTWQKIYQMNKDLIDTQAKAHGIKSNFYNWIYPNQKLKVK